MKNETYFDCEIHGEVKAKVVHIHRDKERGTLTMSVCCPICEPILKMRENETKNCERNST